jgi:glycosyltransferase involved in cell wall biosynthesis
MVEISVVIPCYNAARWIIATLQSVFVQQHVNFEVIVVDDGSTDDSAHIITTKFPQVRLICISNSGPSRSRNIGTQAAQGHFIQYLDADDLLAPDKLAVQLQALEQSDADVAYGDWQRLEQQTDGSFVPGQVIKRQLPSDAEIGLFTDFWCPPAAYLFRRTIVDRIGGWNERLPVIQDARFALDAALYGGQFVYEPGIAAYYRTHQTGSVSKRDPIAFNRDVYQNALEVEDWWNRNGELTDSRYTALLRVYGQVARASYGSDMDTFEAAYNKLEHLSPGYIPQQPQMLSLLSRILGYRRAEAIAKRYRLIKAQLKFSKQHRVFKGRI